MFGINSSTGSSCLCGYNKHACSASGYATKLLQLCRAIASAHIRLETPRRRKCGGTFVQNVCECVCLGVGKVYCHFGHKLLHNKPDAIYTRHRERDTFPLPWRRVTACLDSETSPNEIALQRNARHCDAMRSLMLNTHVVQYEMMASYNNLESCRYFCRILLGPSVLFVCILCATFITDSTSYIQRQ